MIEDFSRVILQLPKNEFWLLFAMACALAAACFYFAFRYFWRYRMMQDMPTALLRSAAQGYNEFKGKASLLPGEPIIAPLTKLSCVWYEYTVEEKQSHHVRGRSRTSWRVYETGVSDGVFALLGETGKAIVDPDDAEVVHSISDSWYGSTPYPSAGPRGFSSTSVPFGKRYRYSEKRIHEDDFLYVLGHFSTFREIELPSEDESLAILLRSWKNNPEELLRRFDENKDSQLDPAEWQKAVWLAKKLLAESAPLDVENQIDNMIKNPTDSRKPFLISTQEESLLVRNFQYKSWVALFLFFALGTLTVWAFNIRF